MQQHTEARAKFWHFLLALFIPIVGFIIAIVLLARNAVGPGLAVAATAALGVVIALSLYGA